MGKELVIIAGPTASGKSAVSVALAGKAGGEIISADSMQVYKNMDIGSAKITPGEMKGVAHHLIDILEPAEEFNVSVFCARASAAVEEIKKRGHLPVICGGTGFYIRAFLYGIDFAEGETDPTVRQRLEEKAREAGTERMEEELKSFDPVSAGVYHGNLKRIIRALEYHELTGRLMSEKNAEERARRAVYDAAFFVLTMPREMLYERIDKRVDLMMEAGLTDEVRRLREMGVTRDMTSMQGLGYRQIYDHIEGRYDLQTAVDEIKKQTRHFAKRQLTWFRREKGVIWVDVSLFDSPDAIADHCISIIRDSGGIS
ncbi:MAG: tRNA (adenosine(37)-N6)-dimethylallyltransferase MiaA [Lachnospiraceae bacterium]|nr:tRNA (adenosine(37)-N6)-dimethylallyltransferase MiaA [Lachnospiraceae bacterium]